MDVMEEKCSQQCRRQDDCVILSIFVLTLLIIIFYMEQSTGKIKADYCYWENAQQEPPVSEEAVIKFEM